MGYIILGIIVIFFALAGFTEFIKALIFRFYKSKDDRTVMLISPIDNNQTDVEYILRSCAAKVMWMGSSAPKEVICLDNGMDNSTREICEAVCSDYKFIRIMNTEELTKLLGNNEKSE